MTSNNFDYIDTDDGFRLELDGADYGHATVDVSERDDESVPGVHERAYVEYWFQGSMAFSIRAEESDSVCGMREWLDSAARQLAYTYHRGYRLKSNPFNDEKRPHAHIKPLDRDYDTWAYDIRIENDFLFWNRDYENSVHLHREPRIKYTKVEDSFHQVVCRKQQIGFIMKYTPRHYGVQPPVLLFGESAKRFSSSSKGGIPVVKHLRSLFRVECGVDCLVDPLRFWKPGAFQMRAARLLIETWHEDHRFPGRPVGNDFKRIE